MVKRKKLLNSVSIVSIFSFVFFMTLFTFMQINHKLREFEVEVDFLEENQTNLQKSIIKKEIDLISGFIDSNMKFLVNEAQTDLEREYKLFLDLYEEIKGKSTYTFGDIGLILSQSEDKLGFYNEVTYYKLIKYSEELGFFTTLIIDKKIYKKKLEIKLVDYINTIRYGEKRDGYIFIFSYDGLLVLNPMIPNRVGKSIKNLEDINKLNIFDLFINTVKENPEGGYASYFWKKPSSGEVVEKVSFVTGLKEFKWIVGTGTYIDDIKNEVAILEANLNRRIEKDIRNAFFFTLLFLGFYLAFLYSTNQYLSRDFISFKTFFKEAIVHNKKISKEELQFEEFFELACYANRMLEDKKRLEFKLTQLAMKDELTGVSNRRSFFQELKDYYETSLNNKSELSIMMLDIDHFKSINDNYGHKTGDIVLERFVDMCKSVLREKDIIGRIGGEEFSIILPGTNLVTAKMIGERIVNYVAKTPITIDEDIYITVSVGVTNIKNRTFDSPSELLNLADEKLYLAKTNGRNQVYV